MSNLEIRRSRGFTLVELSIVLVIIALVIGGVLVGQDLIKSAKIQSVVNEVSQINTGISAFRAKYQALPGDYLNIEGWPELDASAARMNSNGDGYVTCTNANGSECSIQVGFWGELLMVWKDLDKAGMLHVPSLYVDAATAYDNIPTDAVELTAYLKQSLPKASFGTKGSTNYVMFMDSGAHYLRTINAGSLGGGFGLNSAGFTITPAEALQYDLKVDDGLPLSGVVVAEGGHLGVTSPDSECVSSDKYLAGSSAKCNLRIKVQM